MSSKYRSPNGARYLEALFLERSRDPERKNVVYTLKDEDSPLGYPSLYRLYIEKEDITEWGFANAHLDGWEHWEMLCKCSWFAPLVLRWRKELELKIRGRALSAIREEAEGGKNAYHANKLLLQAGWKDPEESQAKRGRPSKDEIKKEAEKEASNLSRLAADAKRVTLVN